MNIIQQIEHFFGHISEEVWEFLLPLLEKEAAYVLKELAPIAIAAVVGLTTSNLSGSAKYDAAFQKIAIGAESIGLVVSESMINTVLEIAVRHLYPNGDSSIAKAE